jgi:hypothetical protein
MKTTVCQIEYPTVPQCLELRKLGVKIPAGTKNKEQFFFAYTYLKIDSQESGWYFGMLHKKPKQRDYTFICELGIFTIFCNENGELAYDTTVLCPTQDQVIELLGNYKSTSKLSKMVVQALESTKEITCTELLTDALIDALIDSQK